MPRAGRDHGYLFNRWVPVDDKLVMRCFRVEAGFRVNAWLVDAIQTRRHMRAVNPILFGILDGRYVLEISCVRLVGFARNFDAQVWAGHGKSIDKLFRARAIGPDEDGAIALVP